MHAKLKAVYAKSHSAGEQDTWLTPPDMLKCLGKFDLDPCCPPKMPWKTAKKMIHEPQNGLVANWAGRVWCNPPYSKPAPWVEKMAAHGNGIILLPANIDTKYGQLALLSGSAVFFVAGRLLFHREDGSLSSGRFLRNMLVCYGKHNIESLRQLQKNYVAGALMALA